MTAPTVSPPRSARPLRWVRTNLFRNARDSVTTVVVGAVTAVVVFRVVRYVGITGRWNVVDANLGLYLYGRYPRDELWRLSATVVGISGLIGLLAGVVHRRRTDSARAAGEPLPDGTPLARGLDLVARFWPFVVFIVLCLALSGSNGPFVTTAAIVAAGVAGRVVGGLLPPRIGSATFAFPFVAPFVLLPFLTGPQGWDEWGGLHLTLFLTTVSMLACFPLGLVLALGRRAGLPATRTVSVGFIEFFRGVPLVVLVLMSDVALGFFFPQSILPGKVVRVIIVFTIFTAAYVAEIVRGGLQSVPRGQTEAAQALGMSPVRIMALIVLPQALRNVIPALVGQFISLFKDTTLVFVIGFLDVLTVADAVTKQRGFDLTQAPEALAFAALMFWVGSYTLSMESQRLEARLGVGTR